MIKSLDIEPTTICNLKCPFCFGPKVESRKTELDIKVWKDSLFRFRDKGVQNIVISGGEPLLYNKITELVIFLKGLGYNIVISTHGRFKEKLFEIAPYCDWISLPIDGINDKTTQIMRTDAYSNQQILETAKELKSFYNHLGIKIGTVATKENIHEILEIGELLETNSSILDTWKIYQYTPRRKYKNLKDSLFITDEEFFKLSSLISNRISDKIRVVYSSIESRKNAYTFIYHNGDVNLVNVGNELEDLNVGNIQNFDEIDFSKIYSFLDANHIKNYFQTY